MSILIRLRPSVFDRPAIRRVCTEARTGRGLARRGARLPRLLRLGRQPPGQRDLGFAEQLTRSGERLMPVVVEVGIEPGEPELMEIHNIVRR